MGVLDLDKVSSREIKKCVSEITDKLCFEYPEFADLCCSLNIKDEEKLEAMIFNIVEGH
jgi:hypothetical protein